MKNIKDFIFIIFEHLVVNFFFKKGLRAFHLYWDNLGNFAKKKMCSS